MKNFGFIFDMDNTLLDTNIDFKEMHRVTVEAVKIYCGAAVAETAVDFSTMVTGQVLNWAISHGLSKEQEMEIWEKICDVETLGMQDIHTEPNAEAMLASLKSRGCHLFVLTNNSLKAAKIAMEKSGLAVYFDEIHARDEYGEVKPSPKGINSIIADHPRLTQWLMVGDSWLDGGAAKNANIAFAAYGANGDDYWQEYQIEPVVHISQWNEQAAETLISVLK